MRIFYLKLFFYSIRNSFNFCTMLAERYSRIIFVVFFMIIGNILINNLHLFQAPFYYPDMQSIGCKQNWWRTILFINNFYTGDEKYLVNFLKLFFYVKYEFKIKNLKYFQCIPQSWFLCVNFHFFLLTPLVILPIFKYKRLIWFIFPLLLIGAQAINFAFTYWKKDHLKHLNL